MGVFNCHHNWLSFHTSALKCGPDSDRHWTTALCFLSFSLHLSVSLVCVFFPIAKMCHTFLSVSNSLSNAAKIKTGWILTLNTSLEIFIDYKAHFMYTTCAVLTKHLRVFNNLLTSLKLFLFLSVFVLVSSSVMWIDSVIKHFFRSWYRLTVTWILSCSDL